MSTAFTELLFCNILKAKTTDAIFKWRLCKSVFFFVSLCVNLMIWSNYGAGRSGSLKHMHIYNKTHTLWLLSPSRLAVVTKQVPSSRDDDKRMRSQGKVSSSFTKTTSPTWDRQKTWWVTFKDGLNSHPLDSKKQSYSKYSRCVVHLECYWHTGVWVGILSNKNLP